MFFHLHNVGLFRKDKRDGLYIKATPWRSADLPSRKQTYLDLNELLCFVLIEIPNPRLD